MANSKISTPKMDGKTIFFLIILAYSNWCSYNRGKNIDNDLKTVQQCFESLSKGMAKLQK